MVYISYWCISRHSHAMASSANWAIQKTCMDNFGILMVFVVSIGHGVKYSRMNITQQGISHIPFTCSYRYTRSPVEDVILCDQEPRCIALYKKWETYGTRVHQTCNCAIHPGNSTLSIIERTHIFMPIHRSENRPGRSLNTLGPEHILQKHFLMYRIGKHILFAPYSGIYGT